MKDFLIVSLLALTAFSVQFGTLCTKEHKKASDGAYSDAQVHSSNLELPELPELDYAYIDGELKDLQEPYMPLWKLTYGD